MSPKHKKYIVFVIILLAIAFGVWFFLNSNQANKVTPSGGGIISRITSFFKGNPVSTTTPSTPPPSSEPPSASPPPTSQIPEEQKLVQLTDFPVISVSLNAKGDKVLFYKKDGGDLFSSDFRGKEKTEVSNITIIGLVNALWSNLRDRAAVFYLDDETPKSFLHQGTSTITVLPPNVKSFSWSPDGKSIAYLLPKNNQLSLVTANSSNGNPRAVFSTPIRDSQISWVGTTTIAFQTAPSGLAEGYLFTYNITTGRFNRILGPFFGLMSLWSPDATKILVSSTKPDGTGLGLSVYSNTGDPLFSFARKTIPEKCVFINALKLLCGVPRLLSATSVLPDEYLRGEINTSDTLIEFDLKTQDVKEIMKEGNFDMSNLLLSKEGDYLFFVNRTDGTLWSYRISL